MSRRGRTRLGRHTRWRDEASTRSPACSPTSARTGHRPEPGAERFAPPPADPAGLLERGHVSVLKNSLLAGEFAGNFARFGFSVAFQTPKTYANPSSYGANSLGIGAGNFYDVAGNSIGQSGNIAAGSGILLCPSRLPGILGASGRSPTKRLWIGQATSPRFMAEETPRQTDPSPHRLLPPL